MFWLILVFLLTSAFWGFILYYKILYYQETIEWMLKELEKDYDEELLDKRTFRRHKDKLIIERDNLLELIDYMKKQSIENRIYKKYFRKQMGEDVIINNIKNESNI